MDFGLLKRGYKQVLEYSFIFSLILLITLFYFSQRQTNYEQANSNYVVPEMKIIQIPRTVQRAQPPPKPLKPVIPVSADELDILSEVVIEAEKTDDIAFGYLDGSIEEKLDFSMMPRQIVEVVPDLDDEEVNGLIVLSLQIGIDGKIINYKVVTNTTNSAHCLQEVISAARRSKWQPAILDSKPVEFWIEKTYKIN